MICLISSSKPISSILSASSIIRHCRFLYRNSFVFCRWSSNRPGVHTSIFTPQSNEQRIRDLYIAMFPCNVDSVSQRLATETSIPPRGASITFIIYSSSSHVPMGVLYVNTLQTAEKKWTALSDISVVIRFYCFCVLPNTITKLLSPPSSVTKLQAIHPFHCRQLCSHDSDMYVDVVLLLHSNKVIVYLGKPTPKLTHMTMIYILVSDLL